MSNKNLFIYKIYNHSFVIHFFFLGFIPNISYWYCSLLMVDFFLFPSSYNDFSFLLGFEGFRLLWLKEGSIGNYYGLGFFKSNSFIKLIFFVPSFEDLILFKNYLAVVTFYIYKIYLLNLSMEIDFIS